jgi:hypothetical protein
LRLGDGLVGQSAAVDVQAREQMRRTGLQQWSDVCQRYQTYITELGEVL